MNAEETLQQLSIAFHHSTASSSSSSASSSSASSSSFSHLRFLDDLRYDVTSRSNGTLFRVVAPFLFFFFTVVGFAGNVLVIYVIGSRPQMQTVTNLLLLNLAVADLCFVLLVPPLTAYDYAVPIWTIGDFLCRVTHYVINVTAYVSVYTLVVISVIRYLTVVHNTGTLRFRTKRNVMTVVMVTWLTMVVVNVPVFASYSVRSKCNPVSDTAARWIFTTFFVFGYLLPVSVIALLSACILRHIARHRRPGPGPVLALRSRSESRKRQASRLLVVVVAAFVLLWMPMHLLLLYRHYFGTSIPDSSLFDVAALVIQCLPYVNSCVNPLIYSHSSKDFRDAFAEVVSCPGSSSGGSSCEVPAPRQGAPRTPLLTVPGAPFVELEHDGALGARRVTHEHKAHDAEMTLKLMKSAENARQ